MSKRKLSDKSTPLLIGGNVKSTSCDKPYDLKIVTWNVAGFKAVLKKGFENYFKAENPDIICLQETKCPEQPPFSNIQKTLSDNLNGYKYYWHENLKPGYAGVSTWSKLPIIKVTYGIDNKEEKQGRVITLELENMFVVNSYVPNSGEKLVNLEYRQEWNIQFENYLKSLDMQKPVLLCGDLNVAHTRIDLTNPDTNLRSAGFTIEERQDFTRLLSRGFVDVYRKLYPTKEKTYTYWSYRGFCRGKNVGWRIDYFVISERLVDKVVDCVPRMDILGSDHCPLVLFIKT